MDEEKKDLSQVPAFAPEETPQQEEAEEEKKEEEVNKTVEEEEEVEEPRVPYSRFKSVREAQLEAEKRAAELEAQLAEREEEPERQTRQFSHEPPQWWTRLYGDSAQAKEAWVVYNENQPAPLTKEEIRREVVRAYREEQRQEASRVSENLNSIEDNLGDLEAFVGRPLSEDEQSEILDIADEYTPKDDDGNYLGPVFPFEKAWEIRELRSKAIQEPRKKSRDKVASLTASEPGSTPSPLEAERDKSFDPRNMDGWRNNPLLRQ